MRRRFRLPLIILLLYSIIVPTIVTVAASPRPALTALNTRVVKGKIRHFVGGAPWVNAEVTFVLEKGSYTPTDQFVPEKFTAKTDSNGDFSVTLVCNNDWQIAVRYRCILPGGDSFTFNLQPGSTPVELSTLRTPVPASAQPSLQAFIDNHADDIATADIPGHIRVGNGLSINPTTGVLSVTGGALSSLSDTQISSPAAGQYLRYNGTKWANSVIQSGDLPSHTHVAADVTNFNSSVDARITSGAVIGALGYTPLNKAGDTLTGILYIRDPSAPPAIPSDLVIENDTDVNNSLYSAGYIHGTPRIYFGKAGSTLYSLNFSYVNQLENIPLLGFANDGTMIANGGQSLLERSGSQIRINNNAFFSTLALSGLVGVNQPTPGAQLHVNTSSPTTVGQIIQLSASQSADAWQVKDSGGTILTSVSANGSLAVNNSSTLGFRIFAKTGLNSQDGLAISTNSAVGSPGFPSVVWSPSWDNGNALLLFRNTNGSSLSFHNSDSSAAYGEIAATTAGIRFSPGSATRVAGIFRAAASQTANITEWQNNGGTLLSSIAADGTLTVPTGAAKGIYFGSSNNTIYYNTTNNRLSFSANGTSVLALDGVNGDTVLHQNFQLVWGGSAFNSPDAGLKRSAAGIFRSTNGSTGYGALEVGAPSTTAVPLTINLVASQSGDALQVKNSGGSVLTALRSDGTLQLPYQGEIFFNSDRNQPSIHNSGNTLLTFWNSGATHAGKLLELGANSPTTVSSGTPDGTNSISVIFDSMNAFTNTTTKLVSFRNAGTEKLSVGYSGALGFVDNGTRPTCDINQRGKLWTTFGAAGVQDSHAICRKSAADTYAWVELPN